MTEHWCTFCQGVNAHNCQFNPNIPRQRVYVTNSTAHPAQAGQVPITSETGNASDQRAPAIKSESGKAGQVLTDEEISSIAIQNPPDVHLYARAIEQAVLKNLKEQGV